MKTVWLGVWISFFKFLNQTLCASSVYPHCRSPLIPLTCPSSIITWIRTMALVCQVYDHLTDIVILKDKVKRQHHKHFLIDEDHQRLVEGWEGLNALHPLDMATWVADVASSSDFWSDIDSTTNGCLGTFGLFLSMVKTLLLPNEKIYCATWLVKTLIYLMKIYCATCTKVSVYIWRIKSRISNTFCGRHLDRCSQIS